jgi:hypothetical protein
MSTQDGAAVLLREGEIAVASSGQRRRCVSMFQENWKLKKKERRGERIYKSALDVEWLPSRPSLALNRSERWWKVELRKRSVIFEKGEEKKTTKTEKRKKEWRTSWFGRFSKEATLADPDTPAKQDKGGSHLGLRSSSAKKQQSQKTVRRKPKKDRTNWGCASMPYASDWLPASIESRSKRRQEDNVEVLFSKLSHVNQQGDGHPWECVDQWVVLQFIVAQGKAVDGPECISWALV